ncbi:hypothetical protein [Nocardiopsis sp. ATB16-24]|uniref:hypothetical protein n=1 Tax=Nocardiopsis sp. ATB16-24 TaxID=3019555 RepID=UPI00255248F5|nr:hypothetical protein [Nocardiopsis sp. ATB16-24]
MSMPLSTSGRVRFTQGRARLLPLTPSAPGMVRAQVSVLSPGTELRHLAQTEHGPDRDAGYMNMARTPDGGWILAPCAHGAAFTPHIPGAVKADGRLPAHLVAMGRFQLMAACGLTRLPEGIDLDEAVVVGSGPVAAGCVLELRRRGADRIRLWTRRTDTPPIAHLPGLACMTRPETGRADLVVDATGQPQRALEVAGPGTVVGLLGTPDTDTALDALAVHRSGAVVVGMHELAGITPGDPTYQDTFDRVLGWLADVDEQRLLASWCRSLPAGQAPEFYADLRRGRRPTEPIVLWEWT